FIGIYQWTSPRDGSHFVRLTFAANAVQHNPNRRLDSGILRAVWLTRDEIAAAATRLRSPMVLSNVDDWISGRRLPLWAITYLAPEPA
ncbi:MAG TPA: NUDIX hydrolase, partial [Rudaea sp.]